MPYCTRQDLIDRYGETEILQLTDRDGIGVIDDTVVTRAIDDAGAEIDGYLAGRYRLPLATVPRLITSVACDLARYHLYADGAPEAVAKRHDDAIKLLGAVSRGAINLGLSTTGDAAATSDGAQMESGGRIFGRDEGGFI